MILREGFPKGDDAFFALLIFVVPIISLIALAKKDAKNFDLWPFIMFKRMALEEKKRIEEINNK
jgi:hypothetical protein